MNCHYCHKECDVISPTQQVWGCVPCQTQYYAGIIQIKCQINNQKYWLQLSYCPCDYPTRILNEKEIVLQFDYLLNDITPQNIKDKLKLYLIFS